jgi:hypothetical protein
VQSELSRVEVESAVFGRKKLVMVTSIVRRCTLKDRNTTVGVLFSVSDVLVLGAAGVYPV